MNKTVIRDFYGRIIGTTEQLANGDIQLRDFYGRILGKYDKRLDVTRDFYGRIIAHGNQLSMLLNNDTK